MKKWYEKDLKEMNKKNIIWGLGILFGVILILLILFGVFGSLSIIAVQGIPAFEKIEYWASVDSNVLIKAPFIGEYQDRSRQDICGTNDGDFRVNNEYTLGSTLFLLTSFENVDARGCNSKNTISADFFPKDGELTINFDFSVSESYDGYSKSTGIVYINNIKVLEKSVRITDWETSPKLLREDNKYDISVGDEVRVELFSEIGYDGKSSAKATISFQEKLIPEPPEPKPILFEWFGNVWSWIKGFFN